MLSAIPDLPPLPPVIEWVGWIASVGSLVVAGWAGFKAKGAREQAQLAKETAIRLGRVAQLGDLIADLRELPTLLARQSVRAVADKCARLRGRVERFKAEAYNDLTEDNRRNLDVARDQLEIVTKVAADGELTKNEKIGRIQWVYGEIEVALNAVAGVHRRGTQGE